MLASRLGVVAAVLACLPAAAEPAAWRSVDAYVPGEVLVRLRADANDGTRRAVLAQIDGRAVRSLDRGDLLLVRLGDLSVAEALLRLDGNADLELVEPNYLYALDAVPSDPSFSLMWALHNTGQTGGTPGADIRALDAWEIFTGTPDVIVAVINSGIDFTHPDLLQNVYRNPGEIPWNGIDDDGNGYVDDVRGWNFGNGDPVPMDDSGHGTALAGTAGASGDNGVGITGVAWRTSLLPLKTIDGSYQVTAARAIEALDYAIDRGARIAVMSFGSYAYSQALREAVLRANEAGIVIVASATDGGLDADLTPTYPCAYDVPNVVCVTATDHNDNLASWSNFGIRNVDLAAPGVNVRTTLPGGGYASLSGTSIAAAHVAGALALLVGHHPSLPPEVAKQRLLSGVRPVASLDGKVLTGGSLDAHAPLVGSDAVAPAAVVDLRATTVDASRISLAWTASGDDDTEGRASIYELRYSTSALDETTFDAAQRAHDLPAPREAGAAESAVLHGLAPHTEYFLALRVVDELGNRSPLSNVERVTTLGPPEMTVVPGSFDLALPHGAIADRVVQVDNAGAGTLELSSRATYFTAGEPVVPATFDVVLLTSGNAASQIYAGLIALPEIGSVDEIEAGDWTPALPDLLPYQVVIVMGDYPFDDPVRLGDVLADYVDAGGRVIQTVPSFVEGWRIEGRFLEEGYSPFGQSGGRVGYSALGAFDPDHPILLGITVVTGDELSAATLAEGATWVASWSNLHPLVATRGSRVVGIAILLSDWDWYGDVPQLVRNAALWSFTPSSWLDVSPAAAALPGGARGEVTLHVRPEGLPAGAYGASVVVRGNDAANPRVEIPLRLQVEDAADAELSHLELDFGAVALGATAERTLILSNAGTLPLTVSKGEIAEPPFLFGSGAFELAPGTHAELAVRFRPTAPGPFLGSLALLCDDPDEPVLHVALRGLGSDAPDIAVTPAHIAESLPTGGGATHAVTVVNHGRAELVLDLQLEVPRGGPRASTSTVAPQPGGSARLARGRNDTGGSGPLPYAGSDADPPPAPPWVSVEPSSVVVAGSTSVQLALQFDADGMHGGDHGAELSIRSNDPDKPRLIVPLSLHVSDAPDLVVSETALDFGTVFVGASAERALLVSNAGTTRLTVAAISTDSPAFLVEPSGLALEAGESREVVVAFAPSTAGGLQGSLLFASDDPDEPSHVVTLEGHGLHAPQIALEPPALAVSLATGQRTERAILVRNDGGSDLAFEFEPPGAGWVAVQPEDGVVPSGESLGVTVLFDAAGLAGGTYAGELRVLSNDPDAGPLGIPLVLEVAAAPDIALPLGALDFGVVFVGALAERDLAISNEGAAPLTVALAPTAPEFTVVPASLVVQAGTTASVTLRCSPAAPGPIAGAVEILSDDPDEGELLLALACAGAPAPDLAIAPEGLVAQVAFRGIAERTLTLGNAGEGDLAWSAGASASWVRLDPASGVVPPSSATGVSVTLDATGLTAGQHHGEVVVTCNDPDDPERIVPVTLDVQDGPDLDVSAPALDFGSVALFSRTERTLVATNRGTLPLHVSALEATPPVFTCSTTGFSLAAGESREIVVALSPDSPGPVEGTLHIRSNDEDEDPYGVALHATVLPAPEIVVAPASLAASLEQGALAVQSLVVTNGGAGTLHLQVAVLEATAPSQAAGLSRGLPVEAGLRPGELALLPARNDSVAASPSILVYTSEYGMAAGHHDVERALQRLGLAYTSFYRDPGGFEAALGAGPWDLVIFDDVAYTWPELEVWELLEDHVLGGGRLLVSTYRVGPTTRLWRTLGFAPVRSLETLRPVYWWQPDHPLFREPESVPPFLWTSSASDDYGDELEVGPLATAVAGFAAEESPFAGAIVLSKEHLAIVNGFLPVRNNSDRDADGVLDSIELYANEIRYLLARAPWLRVDPREASVAPGQTIELTATFDARQVFGGDYEASVRIESDDPVHPIVTLPASLHVAGAPDAQLAADTLDFGPVLLGAPSARTLTIANAGNALLYVSAISSDDAAFAPELQTLTLAPGASRDFGVTFAPATVGPVTAMLTILSDDPDTPALPVALRGEGVAPPDLVVDPAAVTAELVNGQVASRILTLTNTGGADLSWSAAAEGEFGKSLELIRALLDASHPSLLARIPGRFEFSGGLTGSSITDPMLYGSGNILRTDRSSFVPYSNSQIATASAFGPGGRYFTRKYPGLFVLVADLDDVSWFFVDGTLRAGAAGTVDGAVLEREALGIRYRGFVKRVFGASQPSVNHLIVVEDRPGLTHEFPSSAAEDDHRVRGLSSSGRLYYLLYAGTSGGYIDDAATAEIMDLLLWIVQERPPWLGVEPASGVVPALSSAAVEVSLDARGIAWGAVQAAVRIASNDPEEPELVVPVTVEVSPAPDLELSVADLDFGTLFVGQVGRRTVRVRNAGQVWLSVGLETPAPGVGVAPASVWVAPQGWTEVEVTFAPQAPGLLAGSLVLHTNDPDAATFELGLAGTALLAPEIALEPAVVEEQLFTGQTAVRTLTLTNSGGSDLSWSTELDVPSGSALESILANLNAGYAGVTSVIPARYDFTEGVTSYSINDGGNDMYDGGNRLWTDRTDPFSIPYSDNAIVARADFGPVGRYFTRKVPGLFVLAADLALVQEFRIDGFLGAGDSAVVDGAVLETRWLDRDYRGFVKRVSGGTQPSVNHLVIVEDLPWIEHTYSLNPGYDDHRIGHLWATFRLYYLLYASSEGGYIDDEATLAIMNAFLAVVRPRPDWVSTAPAAGIVGPADQTTLELRYDTAGLAGNSSHSATLRIGSNDPDEPQTVVPITLHVSPASDVDVASELAFGPLYVGFPAARTLTVWNWGSAVLEVTSAGTSGPPCEVEPPAFTVAPGAGAPIEVHCSPAIAGAFTAPLTLVSNDPDEPVRTVTLTGVGVAPPDVHVEPPAFAAELLVGETAQRELLLRNDGDSDLAWELGHPQAAALGLEQVLDRLNARFATITERIPERYNFAGGASGSTIDDGVIYLYLGNRLELGGYPVPYSDNAIASGGGGTRYFTRKFPGLFVLVADTNRGDRFGVTGTIRSDGSGIDDSAVISTERFGAPMRGLVQRTFGMPTPSVNHLVIVEEHPGIGMSHHPSPIDEWLQVTGLSAVTRLYYLLYASDSGNYVDDAATREIMESFLAAVRPEPSWIDFLPRAGVLPAGGSAAVGVSLDATWHLGGEYATTLELRSNDPDEPRVEIPVALDVIGVPRMDVAVAELPFAPLFVGGSATAEVTVHSVGTGLLHVTGTTDDPQFTVDPVSLAVPPGEARALVVRFAPTAVGAHEATLTIASDDPVAPFHHVTLHGVGLVAPDVAIEPDGVTVDLGIGESTERTVSLSNVGGAELAWEVTFPGGVPSLEAVLGQLDRCAASVTAVIPARYDFPGGTTGSSITDSTTFSSGNQLELWQGPRIPYSDGAIAPLPGGGPDGRYFTRKVPGLFVFAADVDEGPGMAVEGGLRVTGPRQVDGSTIETRWLGADVRGFIKRVFGSTIPSVNHLFLVADAPPQLGHDFPVAANNDAHGLYGLSGTTRIYYLLFTSSAGAYVEDDSMLQISRAFLACAESGPPWLAVAPLSGTLAGGEATALGLGFDTTGLADGSYATDLLVRSNDPDEPQVAIPLVLRVHGVPAIQVSPAQLAFGDVPLGQVATGSLSVSNAGTAPLAVDAVTVDDPQFVATPVAFVLEPGQSRSIEVRFEPLALGDHAAFLTLASNDPDDPLWTVPLYGESPLPAAIEIEPGSFVVAVPSGESASRTLELRNVGAVALPWSIVRIGGTGWLSVQPSQGTLPVGSAIHVTVAFDAGGLPPGVRTASLRLFSLDDDQPVITIPITLDVVPAPPALETP